MMHSSTRRAFLATTSQALAGTVLASRGRHAQVLPTFLLQASQPVNAWLPEPMQVLELQTLATSAIDAATRAGASYADIRVAERQTLDLAYTLLNGFMDLTATYSYGVRVLVDGAWAFVHGSVPSGDAMAHAAREAVAMAKGYARLATRHIELLPTPVVTGEWATPYQIDPFTVPLREQHALLGAHVEAVARVPHARMMGTGGSVVQWKKETRVFASSEGSLITQRLRTMTPEWMIEGNCLLGEVQLLIPPYAHAVSGGFEVLTDPAWYERIQQRAELIARYAALPRRMIEVGRYPVVLDGVTLGLVLGQTLGPALELDRVLGYEADASGTSFVSPPAARLGTRLANPVLTVTAHRTSPSVTAVKWDDEGVEVQPYPVITDGRLVNYHSSRTSASALHTNSNASAQHQLPVPAHGCAVAPEASDPVLVRTPHLTVTPSHTSASLDELCQHIERGLLVIEQPELTTDQQLASGQFTHRMGVMPGLMCEIVKGKLVRRLEGNSAQFKTADFWNTQLVALGDASTVSDNTFDVDKGMPWRSVPQGTTTPAGLFKDVSVLASPRQL